MRGSLFVFGSSVLMSILGVAHEIAAQQYSSLSIVGNQNRTVTIFDDFTNVSINDPRTHGEFRPRFVARDTSIRLRSGDSQIGWVGQSSDRGVLQAYGVPFLSVNGMSGISEMDLALRRLVSENREIFQVTAQDLMLDRKRTKFSGAFKYITYQRLHRVEGYAYPVQGAFITFRFKFDRLISFTNFSFGAIGEIDAPTISMQDAFETVIEDCEYDRTQDKMVGKVVAEIQPYYVQKNQMGFRFVYKMDIYKDRPKGLWQYMVGARDGKIVQLTNNFRTSGHVSGEIYARKVGEEVIEAPLAEVTVRVGAQRIRTDLEGNYNSDSTSAIASLNGPRVSVREGGRKIVESQSNSEGAIQFLANRYLSETMSYVHVNRVNAFARKFIKSAPREVPGGTTEDFLNTPIVINTKAANDIIKGCNAWYDPQMLSLNFLEATDKCEASSHFSDIIYHEWGHSLDDALGGIQDSAFSEAIGDVISAIMTDDPRIAPGFVKNSENPIRNINMVRVFPRDRGTDPHIEGLIVSGAWFEALQEFKKHYGPDEGRLKMAEIFFKHLISTDSYLDSYLGALTVDDDDGNLSNCTPHMCFLNAAFTKRGLASADGRCFAHLTDTSPGRACAESTIKPNP